MPAKWNRRVFWLKYYEGKINCASFELADAANTRPENDHARQLKEQFEAAGVPSAYMDAWYLDGELEELPAHKKPAAAKQFPDKASTYGMLEHIARERGYGDGWASHKFRAIYTDAGQNIRRERVSSKTKFHSCLGRAAAHGRRRTRAVLQRRGSIRHELSVAAPVRQAIASGAGFTTWSLSLRIPR